MLEGEVRELASSAVLAFLLRGIGAVLAFGFNVAIARLLGADGAGQYFFALSVTMIASAVGRLGFDSTILRFVSWYSARDDWHQVLGLFAFIIRVVLITTVLIGCGVAMFALPISEYLFNQSELAGPLRWMGLSIISFSLMYLLAEALKGLMHIRASMIVSGILHPLIGLILITPLTAAMGTEGAALSFFIATTLSAVVGFVFWHRAVRKHRVDCPRFERHELVTSARSLWVVTVINQAVLPWAPLFLLGLWGSAEETGIFGAAVRLASLTSIFLISINTVLAPKFSQLHSIGQTKLIGPLAQRFALFSSLATAPIFIFLIFGGDKAMGLFGPEFRAGGTLLAIISTGQLFSVLCGSVGFILIMTGNEKSVRNATLTAAAISIVLAVALIPNYGALGAAVASATGVIASNLFSVIIVWKRLGFLTIAGLGKISIRRSKSI